MPGFLISIIRPKDYPHSDAFREVAETLLYGLQSLGHRAAVLENTVDPQATNIILGAHLLSEREAQSLPPGTIIYNLEQLGASQLPAHYDQLSARYQIWDYTPVNLAFWGQRICAFPPLLVEIGYAPQLSRIAPVAEQDIDVLFYGSINERRRDVLRRLEEAGVRVCAVFGAYGRERDALIARAKIVLNMHCYEAKLFEAVRVSYLLANAKAVVSETSPDISAYAEAVADFPYEELVQGCLDFLRDDARRSELEQRGLRFIRRRGITQILAQVLPGLAAAEGREQQLRKLYLDMVQKCIINVIYEDPNQSRWAAHEYNDKLREYGRDWPSLAHSMIGNARMTNLRQIVEHVIEHRVPGDLIETGVWRGGACIMMRAILKAYGVTDRRVWVADSFCGLPAPNPGIAADAGDLHHTFRELAIPLEQVQSNFARYDLLDDQVRFLKGWFCDTLPGASIESLAVLRLDGDMYGSTMDALVSLYDKVSPGGFIIVDDFGAVLGCRKAIEDFRAKQGITDPIANIDGYGVFWQKSKPQPTASRKTTKKPAAQKSARRKAAPKKSGPKPVKSSQPAVGEYPMPTAAP